MERILIDTDIGCDYDDMYALAYLLMREDADILGITTVTGEPLLRAQLASVICTIANRDIPIYIGNGGTNAGEFRQNEVIPSTRDVISKFPHKESFPENAVDFLKDTFERHPGEITLYAIGPLTNIAELFTKYPHTAKLIKTLIIMGGRFGEVDTDRWGENEWNIINDIEAAKVVFDADVSDVRVFGIELTCKCFADAKILAEVFAKNPLFKPCAVAKTEGDVWFHDPIAAVALFCTDGMTFKKGKITVTDIGETIFIEDANGNHNLMTDMDNTKFFDHYCKAVGVESFYNK